MLEIVDTAGLEAYGPFREHLARDGEGFVLVYSITSRSSFTRISALHRQVIAMKGEKYEVWEADLVGSIPVALSHTLTCRGHLSPIMLMGTKCDRVTEREVSTQEGAALAKQLGCQFVEASIKNCVNIEKAFYDVVRAIRQQRKSIEQPLIF